MDRLARVSGFLRAVWTRRPFRAGGAIAGHGSKFLLARWLFLRLLGVTFLIAFVSLWIQVEGLIGERGILPAAGFLDSVRAALGAPACYWHLPTLSWLNATDGMLHAQCAMGVGLSVLLIADVAPKLILILLWAVYLSVSVAGQMFLGFQWDALLLETGFCAWFITPWRWRPGRLRLRPPSTAGILLLHFLAFKLMFLSGITKLLSGDETWRNLTAMDYHYFTQPIPSWTSWYMHQLPAWFQKLSVGNMFVIEMVLPFAIFGPRLIRHLAAAGLIVLQITIAATGNYGFFNLLTVVLCVLLIDDRALTRLWPRFHDPDTGPHRPPGPRWYRAATGSIIGLLLLLSVGTTVREMVRTAAGPPRGWIGVLLTPVDWVGPLRTINGYGLFRVMTTRRPEFVIRGSLDGQNWREYEFRYKPGDVTRAPPFVAPHMPRLDWQMWFAALNPGAYSPMLQGLIHRLFENEPAVIRLLAHNPFPDAPPRYAQLIYFEYTFTDRPTRRDSDRWWNRSEIGRSEVIRRHPR